MNPSRGNILLVDDDPAILLAVGDQLRSEGYLVTKAESGEACLGMLERVRPDLIVLDIRMPGLGGIAFLRHITAMDGTLRYPVLVFTARAEMDRFFGQTLVDGFLPKTAEPGDLLREIEKILAKRRRAVPAEPESDRQLRLLVAEDDPDVTRELSHLLKATGYSVTFTASGYEMLDTAMRQKPDIIVLKYILPHMNGPAVANILAGMPSLNSIPVVLYDDGGIHESKPYPNVHSFVRGRSRVDLVQAIEAVRAGRHRFA
jgi:CheY-like chemotaxis protein